MKDVFEDVHNEHGGVAVEDNISKIIGRPVKSLGPVAAPAAKEKEPAKPAAAPAVAPQKPNTNGVKPSIESILGYKPEPIPMEPIVSARFKMYSEARKNGFSPDIAAKTAMEEAAVMTPDPSNWRKFKSALNNAPTGTGKTFGQIGGEVGDILHRAWSNPMGISDEAWDKDKKKIGDYLEQIDKSHLGDGKLGKFAAGLDTGGAEFAGEQLAPGQIALLIGTFGESALVRAGAKLGIEGAPAVARTLSHLMQVEFGAQMFEGAVSGTNQTIDAIKNGDWQKAGEAAIGGLISGVMARGMMHHEYAEQRVRGDLEDTARKKYGKPEGGPIGSNLGSRFNSLDPYHQALVIHETVQNSPEYKALQSAAEANNEKELKKAQPRLTTYHDSAIGQSFDPNVARRTVRNIDQSMARRSVMDARDKKENAIELARQYYLRQVVSRLRENVQYSQQIEEEDKQQDEQARQEGREQRPARKAEQRTGRAIQLTNAQQIRDARVSAVDIRSEADRQRAISQGSDTRHPDTQHSDDGETSYRAIYYGEENSFGVAGDENHMGVYRQTPRGVQYITRDGVYTDNESEAWTAPDEHTAQVLAQISSLRHSAESLAEQEGANSAHHEESGFLSGLERDLVSGEKTADEVRQEAELPSEIELPTEVDALRSGNLKGPLYDKTEFEFLAELEQQGTEAGFSNDDITAMLEQAGTTMRADTESNLHQITRSGDYLETNKGVRWTMDSRGTMHPSDGGAPVPLLKNGRYSAQMLHVGRSARFGWANETREERRVRTARERAIQAAVTPELSRAIDDAISEAKLQQQNAGLALLPGEMPQPGEPDTSEAEKRRAKKEQRQRELEPFANLGTLIKESLEKSGAADLVNYIAQGNGITPEEVVRLQLTSGDTVEAKVADLNAGDKITDKFRPDHPWVVEQRKDGAFELVSRGARVPLDRLNPSERVKGLVRDGDVKQEYIPTPADYERAAFDAPYVVHRKALVDQVEAISAGEVKVPDPLTPAQAEAQAGAAARRVDASMSNAVEAQETALNPAANTTDRQVEVDVAKSEKAIETAEAAVAQEAEAKAKTVPKDPFPARAPISVGLRGNSGSIKQNGVELKMHYEMVPLDAVVTSHVWEGNQQVVNPEYTKELQPRTINEMESKMNVIRAGIRQPNSTVGYDFAEYADKTINGSMGPAIIEPGGRAVGGNTRIGIMRRHLQNLNEIADPDARDVALAMFRDDMNRLARENGITPPDNDTNYAVVRVLEEPIETLQKAAELGRLFNKSVSVQMTESAKGVSYARSLTPENIGTIGRLVEDHDGLLPAIAQNPAYFAQLVTQRFGIGESEYADWFEPVSGDGAGLKLNDRGKSQFSRILLGTVFKDSSVLSAIEGETPYRALERSLANMVRLRAIADKNITPKIVEAVVASAQTLNTDPGLSHTNDKWQATYRPDQVGFLGIDEPPPPEPDRMTEVLWRALHGSKAASPRVFNQRLEDLIGGDSSANQSLFGQVHETPAEVFNRVFAKEFAEVAHSRRDAPGSFRGITQAEYDAALQNVEFSDPARLDAIRAQEGKPPKTEEPVKAETPKKTGALTPPPAEKAPATPEVKIADAKAEKGYVTPDELQSFLESHPSTKENASTIMRVAQMMAEHVFDSDPPEGMDRKEALAWVLRERVAKLEGGGGKGRGSYSDPLIEKGIGTSILKLTHAADETTFIHEFAHVIFPLLSETDHRNINTILHEKYPQWDTDKPLRGEAYKNLSEKFSHALEKFLRDQNPSGFSAEVKLLLAKVKEMFRKVYLTFRGDPLSNFQLTPEAKNVFTDMFHITDLDISDSWHDEVEKAKKAEKAIKGPLDQPHPLSKLASDMGATGLRKTFAGKVEDTIGDRVDPKKPMAVLFYPDIEKAASGWSRMTEPGSKIDGAEFIHGENDSYGIRFNTDAKIPNDVLYQEIQPKHPGIQLEELKKRLATVPANAPMVRKLVERQIQNLENEIRAKYGAEERKPVDTAEVAKAAVEEKKNANQQQAVSNVRRLPERPAGDLQRRGTGSLSKPPLLGRQDDANVRRAGGSLPGTRELSGTKPVRLQPLPDAGQPVGILANSKFDAQAWKDGLAKAGLPHNAPPPTVTISPETAQQLKYAGQKQIVQMALSALERGDGFVLASGTGTGKTYTGSAIIKEFINANPGARVLYITKNADLLSAGEKSFKAVAKTSFGLDVNTSVPRGTFEKGVHGTTYQRLLGNEAYKNADWDLVVADESGEMRNWFREDSQQGKSAMAVIDKSKKAVYVSATPWHSPMEYGYAKKLGLWEPNQFEKWISENFAHEKIGDKVFARLDPGKQAILRNQLIERGQFVSQMISYEGFTTHFGVVPVTEETRRSLNRIHEGVSRAKANLEASGKKSLASRLGAFEATYTKAFLERSRVPQAIELVKKAREAGWHVLVFSETTSADLFRRPLLDAEGNELEEAGTYRKLDQDMNGDLSRIIPEFGNVFDDLKKAFGEDIVDFSGGRNTDGQRAEAKKSFNDATKPIMYTTYAAGGIGHSFHDEQGTKPRLSVYLGPPYSGVLLDQALGRTWRFGVNSDARAVFLATDSAPDIRLMATKIGPRMRALRASVQGERDALGQAMANYSEEERMREQQDRLAYDQGNEVKVDAQSFQQRPSRKVDIDNWAQISFPRAETAMNKGMKVKVAGNGDDWATLYQDDSPKRRAFNRPPPTLEEAAARRKVNQVAKAIATGSGLPPDDPQTKVDPSEREAVAGGAAAVGTETAETTPEGNTATAGKMAAEAMYRPGWRLGVDGVWRNVDGFVPRKNSLESSPTADTNVKTDFLMAGFWSAETMTRSIARQAGADKVGSELVIMNRRFIERTDKFYAKYANAIGKIAMDHGIDFGDENTMREIWDEVERKAVSKKENIAKAANDLRDLMGSVHGDLAEADVKLTRPDGTPMSYRDIFKNPDHMPHRIDWDAKIEDPATKEIATLKEIMGKTFGQVKRDRMLDSLAQQMKHEDGTPLSVNEVSDYLNKMKSTPPVFGHIHRARTLDFPIYKKDLSTLMGYFNQAAGAIAREVVFGGDLGKLKSKIAEIPSSNGRATIDGLFQQHFRPQDWGNTYGKIYNMAAGFEVLTKMNYSTVKVPFHLANVPVALGGVGGVTPTIKAFISSITDHAEFKKNMAMGGSMIRQINPMLLMEEGTHSSLAHWALQKEGFNWAYRWSRAIAASASNIWMEQHALDDLIKFDKLRAEAGGIGTFNFKGEDATRRILNERMLIGNDAIDRAIKNGEWSVEDLQTAQRAFANFTMFSEHNPMQMPEWARLDSDEKTGSGKANLHRAVRLSYLLSSFAVKVHSLVREAVFDEVFHHGNKAPLAYLALSAPILGQMLKGASAAVPSGLHRAKDQAVAAYTGHPDKHKEDSWDRWLEQFKALYGKHPVVGAIKIYIDGVTSQYALDQVRIMADPLLDMANGDLKKAKGEMRFEKDDAIEAMIGPAYASVLKLAKLFTYDLTLASMDKKGAYHKEVEAYLKYLTSEVPSTKLIPGMETPKKANASSGGATRTRRF
jgi:hypothetical protein